MDRDDARKYARQIALGRAALGAAGVLAPSLVARPWFGREARKPIPKLITRSVAARDVALGLGAILAADRGAHLRGWVEAGALADAGDFVATILAIGSVSRLVRWTMPPVTAALVVAAAVLAPSVD